MGNFFANRSVFISTLALVLFFLAYLFVSPIQQDKAIKDAAYVDKFLNMSLLIGTNDSELIQELELFHEGGIDRFQNEIAPIDDFLSPEKSNIQVITKHVREGNAEAAKSAFEVTASLLHRKKEQLLDWMRYTQMGVANIAILLFLFAIVPSIVRLNRKKEGEIVVQRETASIFDTASEGLFALNLQHEFCQDQSESLKGIFMQAQELQGDFFEFIGQYVTDDTVQCARDYLDLLHGDFEDDNLEHNPNPLRKIEISLEGEDGIYETRYLDIRFSPVMQNDQLNYLHGSVVDVTRRVRLEQELAKLKEDKNAQLDTLFSLQAIDSEQLNSFFSKTEEILSKIDQNLKSEKPGTRKKKREREDLILGIESLQHESAQLGWDKFEFCAHALREELSLMNSNNKKLTNAAIMPARSILENLVAEFEIAGALAARFSAKRSEPETLADQVVQSSKNLYSPPPLSSLQQFASDISEDLGKRANLIYYGVELSKIAEPIGELFKLVAAQLVRNSIMHGCLSPKERLAAGKSDSINICVSYSDENDSHYLIVRDDGEGFDEQKIIDQAIQRELVDHEQAKNIDSGKALRLAFHPNFSSRIEIDPDGDASLSEIHKWVKDAGGRISLRHRISQFCQFQVVVPQ